MPMFRPPRFTAKGAEKISEIERFIFSFVNDIQRAFDALEDKNNGIVEDTTKEVGIIECGTRHGWTYKKYSDGTFIMYGAFDVSITYEGRQDGGLYTSEKFVLQSPFKIKTFCASGSANKMNIPAMFGLMANGNITFYLLRGDEFETDTTATVMLQAQGKYIQ